MKYAALDSINYTNSTQLVINYSELLYQVVQNGKYDHADQLLALLHDNCKAFMQESKRNVVVLSAVLRVLKIVREESLKFIKGNDAESEENLTNRLFALGDVNYADATRNGILEPILAAVSEIISEYKYSLEAISNLSLNHIHSDELILTLGYSTSVLQFLKAAAKKGRVFKVMLCECYPDRSGHKMALELTKSEIAVNLIPDSHVFGLMSRINKVILSCHAVFTDGTIKARTGSYGVMSASKNFSVPIYVCLPQHKIVPISYQSARSFNRDIKTSYDRPSLAESDSDWLDFPAKLMPQTDPYIKKIQSLINSTEPKYDLVSMSKSERPQCEKDLKAKSTNIAEAVAEPSVWLPRWEFIPPGYVDLFLTNLGAHSPTYLYAFVREFFHPTDVKACISYLSKS